MSDSKGGSLLPTQGPDTHSAASLGAFGVNLSRGGKAPGLWGRADFKPPLPPCYGFGAFSLQPSLTRG